MTPKKNKPTKASNNQANLNLCKELLNAESEKEIISALEDARYWDDLDAWQDFGRNENNYSIIGAQQAKPDAALVEKLVNSVDAVLMRECLLEGVDPESNDAPESIESALVKYFKIKDGNLANLGAKERTKLARNIGLVATGKKSKPNYIVFDKGEGQSPSKMPDTFLSLARSNKLKIPFVQGKFNMGGTGVLRFCGSRSFQLVISRRHPSIQDPNDKSAHDWGFTLVRRDDPSEGRKNSVFRYLAPSGEILRFNSSKLVIPENGRGTQKIPSLEWGTIIKLYEYEMTRYKTSILLDLYNQISLRLPKVGLPIRFYERRDYGSRSLETTMSGLHVRLEEDKRDNVEEGFPSSAEFVIGGERFSASIYAFKPGNSVKYKKKEGILFTLDGQTQGDIPQSFYTRKKTVDMHYLADSILVIVDCNDISPRNRETLFMNSRERLSLGDYTAAIEKQLEVMIRSHQGLRELRERRKREANEALLANMKPLREALEDILQKSPSLQALLINGIDISNPFRSRLAGEQEEFIGKRFPTFFRTKIDHRFKKCQLNRRFRVQFETDACNDYFIRDHSPGKRRILLEGNQVDNAVFNLWNGIATLTIELPENSKVGDRLHGKLVVEDETKIDPFICEFEREVIEKRSSTGGNGDRQPPAGDSKGDRQLPDSLHLPEVHEIREEDWHKYSFDRFSALKVIYDGEGSYQFFVNIDNAFLRNEIKALERGADPRLIEARYTYGLVLVGLGLLKDEELIIDKTDEESNTNGSVEEIIFNVSKAISPVILPMIDVLGGLKPDDFIDKPELEFED